MHSHSIVVENAIDKNLEKLFSKNRKSKTLKYFSKNDIIMTLKSRLLKLEKSQELICFAKKCLKTE